MNIGIIGCGAYGIALGKIFNENKNSVTMWTKFEKERDALLVTRENKKTFAGVKIDDEIKITSNLEEVTLNKDIVVIATPAICFDEIALSLKDYITNQVVVIATKGLDEKQGLFLNDVWCKYHSVDNLCVIAGGSFAIDIVSGSPIGLTIASLNKNSRLKVREAMENNHFKFQETTDIYGVEVCSSIKNVLAIASGILDGLGLNESTKCMFLTKSLNDVSVLIKNFGGFKDTILTYAGFGDILLTCTSVKSRNYSYGQTLATKDIEKIKHYEENNTIEGKNALNALYKICLERNMDIGILSVLYKIVFEENNVNLLLDFLTSSD